MQSGAYQNGTWVVGVAKAGNEEGVEQIGNSIIVAPSGEIVAACTTTADELAARALRPRPVRARTRTPPSTSPAIASPSSTG